MERNESQRIEQVALVVTDLDGTFWWSEEHVPAAHVMAVQDLRSSGIDVIAATARRPRYVQGPLQRAGLGDMPYLCLDGSIGFTDGQQFHAATFEPNALRNILQILASYRLDPVTYVLDGEHDVVLGQFCSTSRRHRAFLAPHSRPTPAEPSALDTPVYSLSILGRDRADLAGAAADLAVADAGSAVLAPERTYGRWGLTINPVGVSKWSGVAAYCALKNLDPANVLAVGDGANDVEMLRRCRVPVSVQGGHPDAIAASAHLIDPPNKQGWLAIPALAQQ